MSGKKVRLVVDLVRGAKTDKALDQLKFANKKAALPVKKLIESAIASAVNNFELDKDNLYIKEIKVNEGPALKRYTPKAHGRATVIRKRFAHVLLTLAEIKESGKKSAKKQKVEEPVKLEDLAKPKGEVKSKRVKKEDKKVDEALKDEKGVEIVDPRMEGRHGHARLEGKSGKGFTSKIFRRKAG